MLARLGSLAFALALVAAACTGAGSGEPSDTEPGTASEVPAPSSGTEAPNAGPANLDGDLDPGYLTGTWCDSDGTTWVFDGDTLRVGLDPASLGEPILIEEFLSTPGAELVSRAADEFVMAQDDEEFVFTRGPCDSSSTESIGSGPDLASIDLCVLLGEYKDELASLAGLEVGPGLFVGGGTAFAGVLCTIADEANGAVDVTMIVEAITLEMAAAALGNAVPAPELGPGAMYAEASDDQLSNVVLFPVGEGFVRVDGSAGFDSSGGLVSIPRADLIQVAQRIDQLLRDAG